MDWIIFESSEEIILESELYFKAIAKKKNLKHEQTTLYFDKQSTNLSKGENFFYDLSSQIDNHEIFTFYFL